MSDASNNNEILGSADNFNVSAIESEAHRFLRYEFSVITAENGTDIDCFDPTVQDQEEAPRLQMETDRVDLEEDEPVVSRALLHEMLRTLGLTLPTDRSDERIIFFYTYSNGVSYVIWNVTREDGVVVPFYAHTRKKDLKTPKSIRMLSYENAEATRKSLQDNIDASILLKQKLEIDADVLKRLSNDDRLAIAATYKYIQSL